MQNYLYEFNDPEKKGHVSNGHFPLFSIITPKKIETENQVFRHFNNDVVGKYFSNKQTNHKMSAIVLTRNQNRSIGLRLTYLKEAFQLQGNQRTNLKDLI